MRIEMSKKIIKAAVFRVGLTVIDSSMFDTPCRHELPREPSDLMLTAPGLNVALVWVLWQVVLPHLPLDFVTQR